MNDNILKSYKGSDNNKNDWWVRRCWIKMYNDDDDDDDDEKVYKMKSFN